MKSNLGRLRKRISAGVAGGHPVKNLLWRIRYTPTDLPIVFVVGAPRSGTTLLQRIICTHSSFFSIEGETGLFTNVNIFAPWRRHFGLPSEEIERLYESSHDLVDFFRSGILAVRPHDSSIFVEKTPQHALHIRQIGKSFINAKFVHIIRDPRDGFLSASKHRGIPTGASAAAFARYWKKFIRKRFEATGPSGVNPSKVHDILYEDLVQSPELETRKMMRFLDKPFEIQQLDPRVLGSDRRAAGTNFVRLAEPISAQTVGAAATCLSSNDIETIERICRAEMRHFQYLS